LLLFVAINIRTGEVFHATFPDKGPDGSLRHLRSFLGEKTVSIQDGHSISL